MLVGFDDKLYVLWGFKRTFIDFDQWISWPTGIDASLTGNTTFAGLPRLPRLVCVTYLFAGPVGECKYHSRRIGLFPALDSTVPPCPVAPHTGCATAT